MSYKCKILLDSISETGKRITTFEITFPRIVLAEFNTHRMFSRNSASSRAIPFKKQIDRVSGDPFVPEQFPLNCKGMQPQEYISKNDSRYVSLVDEWLEARRQAVVCAEVLHDIGNVHKQIVNRLLEPFMWHTVIVTATEFDNFFKLRCDENAQYEIRKIADLMYEKYHKMTEVNDGAIHKISPTMQLLKVGEWHCPLVSEKDDEAIECLTKGHEWMNKLITIPYSQQPIELKKRISVARCARVSYLTHEGKRDIEKDLELFERLRTSGHWSPFEHVATPYYNDINILKSASPQELIKVIRKGRDDSNGNIWSGNFCGWKQYRKEFADENCTNFRKE